jgi:hypothetical protein
VPELPSARRGHPDADEFRLVPGPKRWHESGERETPLLQEGVPRRSKIVALPQVIGAAGVVILSQQVNRRGVTKGKIFSFATILPVNSGPVSAYSKRSIFDVILEGLSAAAIIFLIGVCVFKYSTLPQTIPTHFNSFGEVDGHGGKELLLILSLLGILFYAGLTVIPLFPRLLSKFVNTSTNLARKLSIIRQAISLVKLEMIFMLSIVSWSLVRAASGEPVGFTLGFLRAQLPVLIAILAIYTFRLNRQRI